MAISQEGPAPIPPKHDKRSVPVWRDDHHKSKSNNKKTMPAAVCRKIVRMLVWNSFIIVNSAIATANNALTSSTTPRDRKHLALKHLQSLYARHLAVGDFDSINSKLKGQSIDIPLGDSVPEISQSGFTLKIKSLSCFGFSIGDVDLQWSGVENDQEDVDLEYYSTQSEIPVDVELIDLNVACQGSFDFEYIFGSGEGVMNIKTQGNDAKIGLLLATQEAETSEEKKRALQQDAGISDANSAMPSDFPSSVPSTAPSSIPLLTSNESSTDQASSSRPSDAPSMTPSDTPSSLPSLVPSGPTTTSSTGSITTQTSEPTTAPTTAPTLSSPTDSPTTLPTVSSSDEANPVDDLGDGEPATLTFSETSPTILKMSSCNVAINVTVLNFDLEGKGVSYLQDLLNAFDLTDLISGSMGTFLCGFLRGDSTEILSQSSVTESPDDNLLETLAALLYPYLSTTFPESRDPVVVEAALEFPADLQPLNFMYPSTGLSVLAHQVLKSVSSFSFNRFVADFLLNENDEIQLDLGFLMSKSSMKKRVGNDFIDANIPNSIETPFGELAFEFEEVAISGSHLSALRDDSTPELLSLSVVGSHSLQLQHIIDDAKIRVAVSVDLLPTTNTLVMPFLPRTIMLELPVESLEIAATLLLILDEKRVERLPMASLTDASSLIECLTSVLYSAEIVALEMSNPLEFGPPAVSGLEELSPGISRLGGTLLDILYASFGPSLSRAIPQMFETTLVERVNEALDDAMTYNGTCTDTTTVARPPYDPVAAEAALELPPDLQAVDFMHPTTSVELLMSGALMGLSVNQVTADYFLDDKGEVKIDLSGIDFASLLDDDQNSMEGDNIIKLDDGSVGLATAFGHVGFNFEEATILGLNSVLDTETPELLEISPVGSYSLLAQVALEDIRVLISVKVALWPVTYDNGEVAFPWIYFPEQLITFELPVNRLALSAHTLLVVDENMIANLPIGSLRSENSIVDCLISTIYMAKLADLEISDPLSIGVPIISGLDSFSPELSKVGEAIQDILNSSYSDITLSPSIVGLFETVLTKSVNNAMQNAVTTSTGICHESTVVATEVTYDPFAVEAALDLPSDLQPVNFTDPTSTLAVLFNKAMAGFSFNKLMVDSLLNEDGEIQFNVGRMMSRSNCLSLLIDGFMGGQSTMLDGNVGLETSLGTLDLQFEEIAISGLDSLNEKEAEELVLVEPISPHHLQIRMTVEDVKLRVSGKVSLTSDASDGGDLSYPPQKITLTVPIEHLRVHVNLLLVVDEQLLDLTVGSLTNKNNIVNCLRSAVYMAELEAWEMLSPFKIGPPRLTGLDPEFLRAGGSLIESLLTGFDPSSSGRMFESSMSQFLKCAVTLTSEGVCNKPNYDDFDEDVMVDFREVFLPPDQAVAYGFEASESTGAMGGGAGLRVKRFLDSSGMLRRLLGLRLPSLGSASANEGGSSSIIKEGELVSADMRIPMGYTDTRIQLEISDLRIDNVDAIADLSLLNPVRMQAHEVNNSITFGIPAKPLRIGASVIFGITSGSGVLRNEMAIGLDLMASQLIAQIMMRISEKKLLSLSIAEILDTDCLLPTLLDIPVLDEYGVRVSGSQPSISFSNVDFVMGEGTRNMTCVECESKQFQEMSELFQQPDEQEAAGEQLEATFNSIFSGLVEGESSYVQTMIDQYLVNASNYCNARDGISDPVAVTDGFSAFEMPEETSSVDYILAMLIVFLVIMLVTLAITVFVRWVVNRRHRKWLRTLSRSQLLAAYQAQTIQNEKEAALSAMSKSMFRSKEVGVFAKFFVPLLVLGNIALFLSGHLSPAGSIRAYVGLAGETIVLDDVYNFSISQSAIDLWNSDGKVLSTIMFIFSMIWPYLKQLITLIVWFLPTSILSLQQRGNVLHWLDRLAKWSMVDVFVMVFMLVSFRVSFSSPTRPHLPDSMYTVDMMVAPLWGMYANMTAQLISQVSSHFILRFQRRNEAAAEEKYAAMNVINAKSLDLEENNADRFHDVAICDSEEANQSGDEQGNSIPVANGSSGDSNETVALYQSVFYRVHREGADGLVIRRGVNGLIIVGSLVIVALVVAGCAIPSFGTDVLGVVGVLVGLGRGDGSSDYKYSIFSIAKLLLSMTEFLQTGKDLVGLLSIAVLLIGTTFAVPIALVVAQLFRWFYALGQASRGRLDIAIEILEAWQYIEVYVLTILLGIWQLGDVSEYIMNQYCGSFNATFAEMAFFDILADEDAQCFKLQPSVQAGSYILMAAAVVLSVLRTWMKLAIRQVHLQRSSAMLFDAEPIDVEGDVDVLVKEITPSPVLLTDRFRWLLRKA